MSGLLRAKGERNQSPASIGWDVSLVGFGLPSDPRTFSGYAANLLRGLDEGKHVRREFSAKNMSLMDALRGGFSVRSSLPIPRLSISRRWMWGRAGNAILSERLNRLIDQSGDRGPFLEVGTLARIDPRLGRHYQLTDMTIAQARRTGQFEVGKMPPGFLADAEALQHEIVTSVRHVFALSEWTAASLRDDCGVPANRVTVVYAGSNLPVPPNMKVRRKPREILFVGMDWVRKGGPVLLEAFREVRRVVPDVTMRVVGCTPDINEPGVVVEGLLDRRDPVQFERLCRSYLEASCFCLPSKFDPFPNAIIEAMSVGLPAVAFDNGSRREAIVDGETGFLAPDGDVDGLAAALVRLFTTPGSLEIMGQRAQKRAELQFTWKRVVERIGAVIERDGAPAVIR
jgi:glycosyltransferase involved in cell wall biosynthesis